jgi:hypothetical protein
MGDGVESKMEARLRPFKKPYNSGYREPLDYSFALVN